MSINIENYIENYQYGQGQVESDCADHPRQSQAHHARLAMRAARRMASSRQKGRTGRSVCRHLLQMLDDNDVNNQSGRRGIAVRRPLSAKLTQLDSLPGHLQMPLFGEQGKKLPAG